MPARVIWRWAVWASPSSHVSVSEHRQRPVDIAPFGASVGSGLLMPSWLILYRMVLARSRGASPHFRHQVAVLGPAAEVGTVPTQRNLQ